VLMRWQKGSPKRAGYHTRNFQQTGTAMVSPPALGEIRKLLRRLISCARFGTEKAGELGTLLKRLLIERKQFFVLYFKMTKWDKRFLTIADLIATWSKDPSTKVGAVIVKNRRIIATGYNGFPPKIADDGRLQNRDEKYSLIIHAEMNALIQAGGAADGASLYLSGFNGSPCRNCAKHLITAGIASIVHWNGAVERQEWLIELNLAKEIFEEAGVEVIGIDRL